MWLSVKPIVITLIVGAALIVVGLSAGLCFPMLYDWILKGQLSLTPTSTNYELWKETPIPVYLKLYMFSMTNPESLTTPNEEKLNFVEMGPYVFRQVEYKVNKVWNENNTITFQRKRIWHFDKSLSKGSLADKVTNINPVAASIAYTMRNKGKFMRDIIDRIMIALGHKLIITKTVRELLFDGYPDSMLVIAKRLNQTALPYTKFGWFYGRNGSDTYDGTFNMLTGASNLLELGMVKEWNFSNRTNSYHGQCGMIAGSNGEIWPPLPGNETISVFVTDVCTDLKLTLDNGLTYQGIVGNKYYSDASMLENGTFVPDRKCYCEGIECVPSGVMNISSCKFDAPIFVSLPHFYLADPVYLEPITGMAPSRREHEMWIAIEPKTGVPLQVRAQLQLNLLVQPDPYMKMFKDVKRMFVPMLWFAQEASLTSSYANKIKFILILPSLGAVTCFGIAAIGMLLSFIGVFLFMRRKWQGEEGEVLLPREDGYDVPRVNG